MHELAIAESIVSSVLEETERQRLGSVKEIGLRIGRLTDVVPEALEFAFEAITVDSPLQHTVLRIERVPVSGKCLSCRRTFEVIDFVFSCPHCKSGDIEVTGGKELDIAYLEVEDHSAEAAGTVVRRS